MNMTPPYPPPPSINAPVTALMVLLQEISKSHDVMIVVSLNVVHGTDARLHSLDFIAKILV